MSNDTRASVGIPVLQGREDVNSKADLSLAAKRYRDLLKELG
jgi:hypothetical protein